MVVLYLITTLMKTSLQGILAVLALALRVMIKEFVSLMQHGRVPFQHAYVSTYYCVHLSVKYKLNCVLYK